MRIWLITVGEPLPVDEAGERLLRTGILAEMLASHGHEVLWWTSAFDHMRKKHRTATDARVNVAEHYQIQMLSSVGYRSNVGLRRIVDHIDLARRFRRHAVKEPRPDVILCSLPTLELCDAATDFGKRFDVPVVLDVRDLWPDLFVDLFPAGIRGIGRIALSPMFRTVRRACRNATAVSGITDEFVEWGLGHGDRHRTALDRVFPMAYRETAPSESDIQAAREFWRQQGLSEDQFIACFFGTLGRHFDLQTVIAATREAALRLASLRVVLCGVGPHLELCQRAAAGCGAVVLPGWVNAAQIWTLMRMSRVGLAPYVSSDNFVRNLPNKPIEYLSAGLPVVSGLQGVLKKLLAKHECGRTYASGDTSILADLLVELPSRPELLSAMSTNARRLFEQEFMAGVVYSEMESYLQELASSHARRLTA